MTCTQYVGLGSAALGVIGTAILFLTSYVLEPLAGGVFGSDEVTEYNNRIRAKNKRNRKWQKTGFVFLCLSFVAQAVASLL
jgi:hypothetical protein